MVSPTTLSMMAFPSAGSMEIVEVADEPRPISASPRWFGLGLMVLVVLGIAMRIVFAIVWQDGKPLGGDPLFFQQTAAQLAHGNGYRRPLSRRGKARRHGPSSPRVFRRPGSTRYFEDSNPPTLIGSPSPSLRPEGSSPWDFLGVG